ncbi:hypothetical protein [Polycladomyces subterraneus]|uniref:Uncharacterized protein n=1 Tax=Polycladomyces subterraneus TaxID=1016997 RepID=A0ABT8IPG7_9BACL|nr:hypothetical protein [Polycladomyces subterraneus]MDN4594287.1 hypothetical protein [Polycladomyces subterraneus]
MRCSSCEHSVTVSAKVLVWVIGLEAGSLLEIGLLNLSLLPTGLREGVSVGIGLVVGGILFRKLITQPCDSCPVNSK